MVTRRPDIQLQRGAWLFGAKLEINILIQPRFRETDDQITMDPLYGSGRHQHQGHRVLSSSQRGGVYLQVVGRIPLVEDDGFKARNVVKEISIQLFQRMAHIPRGSEPGQHQGVGTFAAIKLQAVRGGEGNSVIFLVDSQRADVRQIEGEEIVPAAASDCGKLAVSEAFVIIPVVGRSGPCNG